MKNLLRIENVFIGVVVLFACGAISLIFDACSAKEKMCIGRVNGKKFTPAHTVVETKRRFSHFDAQHNAVYIYVPEEVFYEDKYEIFYECSGDNFTIETTEGMFNSTKEGHSIPCSVKIGPLFGIKYKGKYDK